MHVLRIIVHFVAFQLNENKDNKDNKVNNIYDNHRRKALLSNNFRNEQNRCERSKDNN